jgi:L-fuconolactonase
MHFPTGNQPRQTFMQRFEHSAGNHSRFVNFRRHHSRLLRIAMTVLFGFTSESGFADEAMIPVVDTHIHLYDSARLAGLPWPPQSDKLLYRSFLADDYNKVIAKNNLAGVIVVEASPRVSDNDWVLYHTQEFKDKYLGLVGALEFDKETFKDDLKRLCQNERFLGLRIGTQYLDQPPNRDYMKDPVVRANLQHLSDSGKTLDFLLIKLDMDDLLYIAKNYPKLKILINNLHHVISVENEQRVQQQEKIKEAASYPNVYCKVTSLIHQCTVEAAAEDRPYLKKELEKVLDLFGEDRLIYGSNWPCIIKEGEFSDHFKVINDYFAPKGRGALEKLYSKNAEQFYGFRLK